MTSKPILYCAWFCPFAQRAWLSLKEKGIDFEYREQDPYDKTPEFLAINPRGLVPALVLGGDVVVESLIVAEFIDEAWPEKNHLYPPMSEPLKRAKARILLDHIGKNIVPHFINLHLCKDAKGKESGVEHLCAGIEELFHGASAKGPFIDGDQFGILDIAFAPFVARMEVLDEFVDLKIFNDPRYTRFHTWWAAAKERPSMKSTTASKAKFLGRYQEKYFPGESKRTK